MARETHNRKRSQKAQGISNPLTKRLYDLKEAAVYLGRPVFSVRTLIWHGALPVIKDGRKMYLDIYDLDKYIERMKETMV
jgi:excisionase family DNA binding protein